MLNRRFFACCITIFFLVAGCATYERQPVPFKMPAAYPNATKVAGATIAAKAYDDPKEAKEAFGWDIRGAGLYPVQVVFDNLSDHSLEIEPSQTFLLDGEGNMWSIIDASLAYDRVAKKSEMSRMAGAGARGAAKTGLLTGAAGALLGAAIGIVSGENVGAAAGKGAALGAAIGATLGGSEEVVSSEAEARTAISEDLTGNSLENRSVLPRTIAHGFIFFPGEAKGAGEIRLQLRVVETGELHTIRLAL